MYWETSQIVRILESLSLKKGQTYTKSEESADDKKRRKMSALKEVRHEMDQLHGRGQMTIITRE